MPVRNAIKKWHWKSQKNLWGRHRNESGPKVGEVGKEGKKAIRGTTYQAIALPRGVILTAEQENRKNLLVQNKDVANSAFLSFGSRDVDEPNYFQSLEILPGQTMQFENNVFVNDLYGACTVAAGQVILSITEGLEV